MFTKCFRNVKRNVVYLYLCKMYNVFWRRTGFNEVFCKIYVKSCVKFLLGAENNIKQKG